MLEVYMKDIIIKSKEEQEHTIYLESIFGKLCKYGMCLHPKECTFKVWSEKPGKLPPIKRDKGEPN